MTKRTTITVGTVVLTIVVAALATPAYASENGKGDEHANANAAAQSAQASGNANAAESSNGQAAAQTSAASASATAPGQVKKADQAQPSNANSSSNSSQQSKANGSSKSTPSSAGVKPSSSTSHNVSAPAASNATKLYGNGQTAGQVAIHNGASGSAVLYGPGNSQPHKTAPCGQVTHGNGGGFDVHALKSHSQKSRCDEPTTAAVPKDPAVSTSAPGRGVSPASGRPAASPATSHDVKGAVADKGAESGVLGAFRAVDAAALPFTGVALWSIALVGLALVGVGLTLRRQAFAAA